MKVLVECTITVKFLRYQAGGVNIRCCSNTTLYGECGSYYDVPLAIDELTTPEKTLLLVTDLLGREISFKTGELLIYHYSDGSIEKKITIE